MNVSVIYADDHIVVIEKPSGMLSVPGKIADFSVTEWLLKKYPNCISHPAVHRLDMDTSGILVFALDAESHRDLSRQFQDREVEKKYIALLNGVLSEQSGRIELPFRLDVENRPLQIYDEIHGKTGITEWQKLVEDGGSTRVEFHPLTGRTHQLRVHSAHPKGLGVPIKGDTLYGGHPTHGELCLHAAWIKFRHPISDALMEFSSKVPF